MNSPSPGWRTPRFYDIVPSAGWRFCRTEANEIWPTAAQRSAPGRDARNLKSAPLIAEVTPRNDGGLANPPAGWGPCISEIRPLPDRLKEAGSRTFSTVLWTDQPAWFNTRQRPNFVDSLPAGDQRHPGIAFRIIGRDAADFCRYDRRQLRRNLDIPDTSRSVFRIVLHAYINRASRSGCGTCGGLLRILVKPCRPQLADPSPARSLICSSGYRRSSCSASECLNDLASPIGRTKTTPPMFYSGVSVFCTTSESEHERPRLVILCVANDSSLCAPSSSQSLPPRAPTRVASVPELGGGPLFRVLADLVQNTASSAGKLVGALSMASHSKTPKRLSLSSRIVGRQWLLSRYAMRPRPLSRIGPSSPSASSLWCALSPLHASTPSEPSRPAQHRHHLHRTIRDTATSAVTAPKGLTTPTMIGWPRGIRFNRVSTCASPSLVVPHGACLRMFIPIGLGIVVALGPKGPAWDFTPIKRPWA